MLGGKQLNGRDHQPEDLSLNGKDGSVKEKEKVFLLKESSSENRTIGKHANRFLFYQAKLP